jgi:hypothetical protein
LLKPRFYNSTEVVLGVAPNPLRLHEALDPAADASPDVSDKFLVASGDYSHMQESHAADAFANNPPVVNKRTGQH